MSLIPSRNAGFQVPEHLFVHILLALAISHQPLAISNPWRETHGHTDLDRRVFRAKAKEGLMFSSNSDRRRRHRAVLSHEALEDRSLLSGSMGSTFAVIPGTITSPGQTVTIPFTINSQNFTRPAGRLILGVDIVGDSSTSLKPQVSSVIVTNATGPAAHPRVTRALYDPSVTRNNTSLGKQTSAVLVQFNPPKGQTSKGDTTNPIINTTNATINGEVVVQGMQNTTGKFLVGFYLPGDVDGSGAVNAADVQAVRSALGSTASDTHYKFDADANRDGRITSADLRTAMKNEGISTTILPTISSNLDPASVTAFSNRVSSNPQVHFTGSATALATVTYTNANDAKDTATTTADANGNYSLMVPLDVGSDTFQVTTHDSFGQSIKGTIAPVTYQPSKTS
jgi:hypothetical protein